MSKKDHIKNTEASTFCTPAKANNFCHIWQVRASTITWLVYNTYGVGLLTYTNAQSRAERKSLVICTPLINEYSHCFTLQ